MRWAIPLSLLACVLLAFFDKISIAALFSDGHFQQAMGIDFDTTRLGILMSVFLLSYGFSSVFLSGLGTNCPAAPAHRDDGGVVRADGGDGLYP